MNITDIKNLSKKLQQSPIFKISLASKELFHSNFWAWIIDSAPNHELKVEAIKIFFPDFNYESGEINIERELHNLDLVIENGDDCYVIENKIKSIPNKKQLEKYEQITIKGKKVKKWLLTTMVKPHFELPKSWEGTPLYYHKIAERIKSYKEQETDPYRKSLLEDYSSVLIKLHELLSYKSDHKYYDFYPIKNSDSDMLGFLKTLDELKIADVYIKSRTSALYNVIHGKLESDCSYIKELHFENAFTNKSGLITVRFGKKKTDKDIDFEIGIQIQHLQYRYFVTIFNGHSELIKNGKIKEIQINPLVNLIEKEWFHNDPQEAFKGSGHKSGMRLQFCSYKSRDRSNTFFYQYRYIKDGDSFEEIANSVLNDLDRAKAIFKDRKLILGYNIGS